MSIYIYIYREVYIYTAVYCRIVRSPRIQTPSAQLQRPMAQHDIMNIACVADRI